MKIIKISDINAKIQKNSNQFIEHSENIYHIQLKNCAKQLKNSLRDKPLLFISGPSGSGKTTSAFRIQNILAQYDIKSYTISMDNYFRENSEPNMPLDENGEVDYESPYCVNIKMFQEHMSKISRCELVNLPTFNFRKQLSQLDSIPFKREPNQIIVVEGIHALNPLLTGDLHSISTRIYVSVRTRMMSKDKQVLHPAQIRLMRRLIRDTSFRNKDIPTVFNFFNSVSRGEVRYIFPYKQLADFELDTFIPCEASVYKSILLPRLRNVYEGMHENSEYNNIIKFFEEINSIPLESIPKTSLIREFAGGSILKY